MPVPNTPFLERVIMKLTTRIAVLTLAVGTIAFGAGLIAQPGAGAAPPRPYRNGSVWDVSFIRVKPGMDDAYMKYLAGQWKAEQEAMKKEGLILSYKVLSTEAHSGTDFNLILMVEFKDLATMEATEDKADAVVQRIIGDDKKQMEGYKERGDIREIVGGRLSREIILEPKK
jgi:hypothetical protein